MICFIGQLFVVSMVETGDLENEFRAGIRAERIRQRRTQAELAALVGRSRKWLSDYERGVIDPSLAGILKLTKALGMRIKCEMSDSGLSGS